MLKSRAYVSTAKKLQVTGYSLYSLYSLTYYFKKRLALYSFYTASILDKNCRAQSGLQLGEVSPEMMFALMQSVELI